MLIMWTNCFKIPANSTYQVIYANWFNLFKTYINYVKGFTFNTTTGRQLSLYDLGGLNKKELVNAINNNQEVKEKLGGDVNIDKMPTEFYTTDDYSVVMILQQDVDTIHSAGTVYVPVGNLRDRQNDVTK